MNQRVDGYTALKAMCSGFSPKEIAAHMIESGRWELSLVSGEGTVNRCLNRTRDEFFKFSEIIAITQFTRDFSALTFFCDEVSATHPRPLDQGEQLQRLEDIASQALTMLSVVGHQIQKLKGDPEANKITQLHPLQEAVRFSKKLPARMY